MSLKVSDTGGGGDFEIVPEGLYVARCYRLIDLGTQIGSPMYGSKEQKKVMLSWELLDDEVKMDDGRPYTIHQTYTASLGEKANLRKDLEGWRGTKFTEAELLEFDLNKVLGSYCQIQVTHSLDGKFANVQSIVAFKGKEKPAGVNELVCFDIDAPDSAVFEKLSENVKAKIMAAPEFSRVKAPAQPSKTETAALAAPKSPAAVAAVKGEDKPATTFEGFKEGELPNLDEIPF